MNLLAQASSDMYLIEIIVAIVEVVGAILLFALLAYIIFSYKKLKGKANKPQQQKVVYVSPPPNATPPTVTINFDDPALKQFIADQVRAAQVFQLRHADLMAEQMQQAALLAEELPPIQEEEVAAASVTNVNLAGAAVGVAGQPQEVPPEGVIVPVSRRGGAFLVGGFGEKATTEEKKRGGVTVAHYRVHRLAKMFPKPEKDSVDN